MKEEMFGPEHSDCNNDRRKFIKAAARFALAVGAAAPAASVMVNSASANNAGTTRQSCKRGYYWDFKFRGCRPKSERRGKNRAIFTD